MADVPKYAETAVLQQAIPIALLPVQSQKSRQVVTVSVLNMITGILSIVIGILAMVMDSDYKETNFYWSTNGGIGIYFGALIILTGILGIISHVRRYKYSALKHVHFAFLIIALVVSILLAITMAVAVIAWTSYISCTGNPRFCNENCNQFRTRCGSCYEDEKTCMTNFQNGAKLMFKLSCVLLFAIVAEIVISSVGVYFYHQENGGGCCSCCSCLATQQRQQISCTVDTPLRAQDGSTIYSACDVPQQSIGMEKSEPPPPYST